MPPWAMVVSGLVMVLLGLAWRLKVLRSKPSARNDPYAFGGDRTSHVLLLVGAVWAGFGVISWLS